MRALSFIFICAVSSVFGFFGPAQAHQENSTNQIETNSSLSLVLPTTPRVATPQESAKKRLDELKKNRESAKARHLLKFHLIDSERRGLGIMAHDLPSELNTAASRLLQLNTDIRKLIHEDDWNNREMVAASEEFVRVYDSSHFKADNSADLSHEFIPSTFNRVPDRNVLLKGRKGVLVSDYRNYAPFDSLFDIVTGDFSSVIIVERYLELNEFYDANLKLIKVLGNLKLAWNNTVESSVFEQRRLYSLVLKHISYQTATAEIPNEIPDSIRNEVVDLIEAAGRDPILSTVIKKAYDSPEKNAYWESDDAWTKVQNYIVSNRIDLVRGDFTKLTVEEIKEILERRSSVVSVLDLKDEERLLDSTPTKEEHGEEEWDHIWSGDLKRLKRIGQDLQNLPWALDAKILFEDEHTSPQGARWDIYSYFYYLEDKTRKDSSDVKKHSGHTHTVPLKTEL